MPSNVSDPSFDRDVGVGDEVVVPGRVLGATGEGAEHVDLVAVGLVGERRRVLAPDFRPVVVSSSIGTCPNPPDSLPPLARNSSMS